MYYVKLIVYFYIINQKTKTMKTKENKRTLEIRKQISEGLKKDGIWFEISKEMYDLRTQLYNELKKLN